MKQIVAFVCEFCPKRRAFKTKSSAARHEKNCYRNPVTRSCVTCKHFEMVNDEQYIGHQFGESAFTPYRYPSCDINKIPIHAEGDRDLQTQCQFWEAGGQL